MRPTADRVKESIFSIFREQMVGAHFLDLCAGTGSIGIEALSRGAKHVTFVESDRRCTRIIERNLQVCSLTREHSQVKLLQCDIEKALILLGNRRVQTTQWVTGKRKGDSSPFAGRTSLPQWVASPATGFEFIYFDPPYNAGLYSACLARLASAELLHANGTLAVEHSRQTCLPGTVGTLDCYRQERYGDTVLSFYRVAEFASRGKNSSLQSRENF